MVSCYCWLLNNSCHSPCNFPSTSPINNRSIPGSSCTHAHICGSYVFNRLLIIQWTLNSQYWSQFWNFDWNEVAWGGTLVREPQTPRGSPWSRHMTLAGGWEVISGLCPDPTTHGKVVFHGKHLWLLYDIIIDRQKHDDTLTQSIIQRRISELPERFDPNSVVSIRDVSNPFGMSKQCCNSLPVPSFLLFRVRLRRSTC